MIASSGVETEIRALGTRFVAIFRFRKICDVDYNLSPKITRAPLAPRENDPPSQTFLFFYFFFSSVAGGVVEIPLDS